MGGFLPVLGHGLEALGRLRIARYGKAEQHLVHKVIYRFVLPGPVGKHRLPPYLQQISALCTPDKTILDKGVGTAIDISAAGHKEILFPKPFRQRCREIVGSVHPYAPMTIQQFNAADVGEMGGLHAAAFPFLQDVRRKGNPVGQGFFVKHDYLTAGMGTDAAVAGLYQGRRLRLALQPDAEYPPRFLVQAGFFGDRRGRPGIGCKVRGRRLANGLSPSAAPLQTAEPEGVHKMAGPKASAQVFQSSIRHPFSLIGIPTITIYLIRSGPRLSRANSQLRTGLVTSRKRTFHKAAGWLLTGTIA